MTADRKAIFHQAVDLLFEADEVADRLRGQSIEMIEAIVEDFGQRCAEVGRQIGDDQVLGGLGESLLTALGTVRETIAVMRLKLRRTYDRLEGGYE